MLKKNILCLVMAAVMTFGTATTAKAEEITSSKDWTVDYKNDKLNSNFTSKEIEEEVYEVPDAGEEATTTLGSLFANIKLD